jgi:hypothetical protein
VRPSMPAAPAAARLPAFCRTWPPCGSMLKPT